MLYEVITTPVHVAFDTVCERAAANGIRVTGSELVGVMPLKSILDAGKYFLKKQGRSTGIADSEIIKIAVKSLGLDELKPFDPKKNIIEYMLEDNSGKRLIDMDLVKFCHTTASEAPARITSYNVCYTKLLRLGLSPILVLVFIFFRWMSSICGCLENGW